MGTSSDIQRCLDELGLQSYSSADLMSFTSNFLESNKIGSGGYGEVYKGQLPNGILIAVKLLKKLDVMEDAFMVEVRTMGKACHRNLIKLYGYCFEDNMQALVYEYMENGSLDNILYENNHGSIEWVKLYAIAIDTANGLKYLHHDLEERIIHHDIKAANVLLDKNLSAKITDFGLARIMNRDVSRVDLTGPRGTHGYTAPEAWMLGSQVTFKCDVYSFGMMLFEVLGKRKNGRAENWFPRLVWKQFENGNVEHFIRTNCGIAEKYKENANILCKVALWCVQYNPDLRPSMKDVVLMLEKEKLVKDPPCPSFEFSGQSDEMELDFTYSQNIIAGPSHALVAGSDGRVAMPQLKSNKRKTLEEDLATLVPNKGLKLPTTILVGKTTALKYKEIILQLIAKNEVVSIGVYGMGGVGKTTIFKHVFNQLLAEGKRFDKIIWANVSKDGNITKLQNDLAKELDPKELYFNLSSENDVIRRSRLLFQALEKRKKVVFFFDDMWEKISLVDIGIPEPTQANGFKLILTTRSFEVCQTMGCRGDNIIKVEPLPQDEAWELFMNKVDCVLTPEVEKIAKMVTKKCFGLPLAIVTVGATMRGSSNITKWRVALKNLNSRDVNKKTLDFKEGVFKCLEFSYDWLEIENQKKCFLCCALYPEDWEIPARDLVDLWIMDGIVVGRNRHDELVEGQYILDILKEHCLLESIGPIHDDYGKMTDGVKIHDLIREMALRITNKCFIVKDPGLEELPNEEEWEIDLERASFMDNMIAMISISPICPNLSTLILECSSLESVTHNFFANMKCLKLLDLRCCQSNNHLELLPDSISDLMNLRALRLTGMQMLKKLPSLAKLVLLRKLKLDWIGIEELPEGMEMLVNLRCLNLHEVKLKERIPKGLISKLSALEELYLGGIEIDKLYDIGSGECFTKELLSLKKLEILNVSFHCLSDYASYVGSSEFNGLNFLLLAIGEVFLYVQNLDDESNFDDELFEEPFLHQYTDLIDMTSLNMFGLLKDVRELERIRIRGGNKIECIWSSKDENEECSSTGTSSSWLQSLQEISIGGCTKLYTIFEGIPNYTSGFLPVFCLKKLEISRCHNLKNVFPSSRMLQLLQNLEGIRIESCDELEEMIGEGEEEETKTPIAIPRLKNLSIGFLKKLKKICRGVMICDSLRDVWVINCSKLKRLPQLKGEEPSTLPPALRSIYGEREWWDSLEWDPAYPKNILQPFLREIGDDCAWYFKGNGQIIVYDISEGDTSSQSDFEEKE